MGTLIRTILSQNTSDVNSRRAYENLRKTYPSWGQLANASGDQIAEVIRSGGLANQKSQRISRVLHWAENHSDSYDLSWICAGDPEEMLATLIGVKGIGVKTAAIVLCFACGADIFPVDTHVNRVSRRLGLVSERSSPDRTFRELNGKIPPGRSQPLHLNMIRHGRTLCRARTPQCQECRLLSRCPYGQEYKREEDEK